MGLKLEELVVILLLIALTTVICYAAGLYIQNKRLRQRDSEKENEIR